MSSTSVDIVIFWKVLCSGGVGEKAVDVLPPCVSQYQRGDQRRSVTHQ